MPFCKSFSSLDRILFIAPLALNEPLFWKHSYFKKILELKVLSINLLALIKGVILI